ncbi:MAG: extra-cytoplasmic solute receptor family protein [Betaproteobacteria bacterium]|nr:extra-cytoplasmic solute receptor family protein [Betaproteobacteria bacterium]
MYSSRTAAFRLAFAAAITGAAACASAQDKPADYPTRPIRLICPVAPGAGNDTITRAAAQMLNEKWGQTVVVDNRSGGGTVIATELGAQAAPDGYTLLTATDTLMLLGAMKRVTFDIRKAFEPVVVMTTQPYILVMNPALSVKSVKELVALSKTKPLSYGSSGVGTTVHLGMERLAALTGARFEHVPYKGTAPALIGVMGGEVHMVPASAISGTSAMKTGKVRALAVMGLSRVPSLPDLPTVAEQGFPGFKIVNSYNLFAPAGTPRPILLAINRVVSEGMRSPQMAQKLGAEGSQPGERLTPDELKAQIAKEYVEVEKQVKQLKLTLF